MIPQQLIARRFIVVTGKGGVGKSTVTAALARCLAALGKRTLALQVDPRENLFRLLDTSPSDGDIVTANDGVFVQNLRPSSVCDWIVERQLKIGILVRRVRESLIYKRFVGSAPGLTEIAILGHVVRLLNGEIDTEHQFDVVILDAPASGHGVSLLRAPRLLADVLGDGPVAGLADEVAELIEDTTDTGIVVVTLAEEMPVQEALELRDELINSCDREPELLIINGLYPDGDSVNDHDADWKSTWLHQAAVNRRELERLNQTWTGSKVSIPLLPVDREADLTRAVADVLISELQD